MVKNPPANAGDIKDAGSISGSGRSPGGGNGNPLQYSCQGNPMRGGRNLFCLKIKDFRNPKQKAKWITFRVELMGHECYQLSGFRTK